MLLGQVFERFVNESPVSVMVRGLLEKALCPQILDELFERSAKTQYTRELLFSTVVNLMSLVVCGIHPSVHAAHQASVEEIGVSVTSVYNKINGIKPSTSGELVREIASQMEATIRHLNATMPDLLPGYRVKIIDGNAIASSEHRLKALREISSAPLPGQSLVVLDPSLMLAVDVFLCVEVMPKSVLCLIRYYLLLKKMMFGSQTGIFAHSSFYSGLLLGKATLLLDSIKVYPGKALMISGWWVKAIAVLCLSKTSF